MFIDPSNFPISFTFACGYNPYTGELTGMGAELLLRFRTSEKERPRYTIQTHGDCDMVLALLGPDDFTKQIRLMASLAT